MPRAGRAGLTDPPLHSTRLGPLQTLVPTSRRDTDPNAQGRAYRPSSPTPEPNNPSTFARPQAQFSMFVTVEGLRRSTVYGILRAQRAMRGTSRFGEPELFAVDRWVTPREIAVDVGANLGFYTYRLAAVSRQVLSIEANPQLARTLKRVVTLLRIPNVSVINAACGASSGERTFVVPVDEKGRADPSQGHLGVPGEIGFAVRVVRVDDLVNKDQGRVGLIKIDVEGAELDVLRGAEHTLTSNRPTVLCEVQNEWCARYGHSAEEVFNHLFDRRYSAHYLDSTGDLRPTDQLRSGAINYVFLPEGTR